MTFAVFVHPCREKWVRILHSLNTQNDLEDATSEMAPIVCSYITNALISLAL